MHLSVNVINFWRLLQPCFHCYCFAFTYHFAKGLFSLIIPAIWWVESALQTIPLPLCLQGPGPESGTKTFGSSSHPAQTSLLPRAAHIFRQATFSPTPFRFSWFFADFTWFFFPPNTFSCHQKMFNITIAMETSGELLVKVQRSRFIKLSSATL